ncbi:MAG: hypothetical protein LBR84_03095 [Tannerella sp.]|jgi:ABC-type phosphate transport system substrate-binding protein|nr:hypothetical protein [Tannerella sp.]
MKRFILKTVLVSVLTYFSGAAIAQEIQIESVKFTHPIIEKWVNEYKKAYPDTRLHVSPMGKQSDKEAISVFTNSLVDNNSIGATDGRGKKVVFVGRYALIPVSNEKNPLISKVGKGIKKKDLVKLVFEKDVDDEDFYEEDEAKAKYTATFYSRSGQSPTTLLLAGYFDREPELIRGKKIVGDEIYLVEALKKDETGLAFNTLNYVFDLASRRLKPNLSVLPLNLKAEVREALLSHNIDKTIEALEGTKVDAIPVENIGLAIPDALANEPDVLRFAGWVLEKGQQYNHELGFLTLDAGTLASQQKKLKSELLTFVASAEK